MANKTTKKLRKLYSQLLALLIIFILAVSFSSIVKANGNESRVSIRVDKQVMSTECPEGQPIRITGEYEIENVSGDNQRVILLNVRDWLHSQGYSQSKSTAAIGNYSWQISDSSGLVLDVDYQVTSATVDDSNPTFQSFGYGPIDDGVTVTLDYTLDFQGTLPDQPNNTIEIEIQNADTGEIKDYIHHSTQSLITCVIPSPSPTPTETPTPTPSPSPSESPSPTPSPTETLTPSPSPSVSPEVSPSPTPEVTGTSISGGGTAKPKVSPQVLGTTAPTPTPEASVQVAGVQEALPVGGADTNNTWFYYFIIIGTGLFSYYLKKVGWQKISAR